MSGVSQRLADVRLDARDGDGPHLLPPVPWPSQIPQLLLRPLSQMQETIALGGCPAARRRNDDPLPDGYEDNGPGSSG